MTTISARLESAIRTRIAASVLDASPARRCSVDAFLLGAVTQSSDRLRDASILLWPERQPA